MNRFEFTQSDVQDHATRVLVALFDEIEEAGAATEKVADDGIPSTNDMSVTISSSTRPNNPIDIVHAGMLRVVLTAHGLTSIHSLP
jgi:hypothetical protein